MEAPEKIYIDNPNHDFWYRTKNSNSIEYTRTDAFIEKAYEFFDEHLWEYINVKSNCDTFINIDVDKLKEDFRNYIRER